MALTLENEEKILNEYMIPFFASIKREEQGKAIQQFFRRIAGENLPFQSKEETALFAFYRSPRLPGDSSNAIQTYIREYLFDLNFPAELNPLLFRTGRRVLANNSPRLTLHSYGDGERPLFYALGSFAGTEPSLIVFKSLYQALETARHYPSPPSIWLVALRANHHQWEWQTQTVQYSIQQQLFLAEVTSTNVPSSLLIPLTGGLIKFHDLHEYMLSDSFINQPEQQTDCCAII